MVHFITDIVCFLWLQYVTETESNLHQVKTLLASTQKDKVELANQLEEEKRYNVGDFYGVIWLVWPC